MVYRLLAAVCRISAHSCPPYTSLAFALVSFFLSQSTSTGARTGCHYLISLSVYTCVTFVVLLIATAVQGRFPQTRYSTMEAGEYGLTRGTCFFARRLEVVAVAGLLRLSWFVLGGVDFFMLSMSLHFQIHS